MKIGEMKTRNGCRVVVEHVGAGCGVTITDASGKSQTLVCGVDEAAVVAGLLLGAKWALTALADRRFLYTGLQRVLEAVAESNMPLSRKDAVMAAMKTLAAMAGDPSPTEGNN